MKRLSIFLISLFCVVSSYSQSELTSAIGYLGQLKLDRAKNDIDKLMENPAQIKEDNLVKAYYTRGEIYRLIANDLTGLYKNLDKDAAEKSLAAYIKAIEAERDEYKKECVERESKGKKIKEASKKMEKKIMATIPELKIPFINSGVDGFNEKNYAFAMKCFEHSLKIDSITEFKAKPGIDTAVYYNLALAADNDENFLKAAQYYQVSINLKYGSDDATRANVYLWKANALRKTKNQTDTLAAVKTLQDGIKAYPNNAGFLIIDLINYYLKSGKTQDALVFLDKAIENEPSNNSLYHAKGTLYGENPATKDKAIEMYKRSIELNPVYFDSYYNISVLFYNEAAEILQAAQNIPPKEQKRYDDEMTKAKERFLKALPYMERAHAINPNDEFARQTLSNIYAKTQKYDMSKKLKNDELHPVLLEKFKTEDKPFYDAVMGMPKK